MSAMFVGGHDRKTTRTNTQKTKGLKNDDAREKECARIWYSLGGTRNMIIDDVATLGCASSCCTHCCGASVAAAAAATDATSSPA